MKEQLEKQVSDQKRIKDEEKRKEIEYMDKMKKLAQ